MLYGIGYCSIPFIINVRYACATGPSMLRCGTPMQYSVKCMLERSGDTHIAYIIYLIVSHHIVRGTILQHLHPKKQYVSSNMLLHTGSHGHVVLYDIGRYALVMRNQQDVAGRTLIPQIAIRQLLVGYVH